MDHSRLYLSAPLVRSALSMSGSETEESVFRYAPTINHLLFPARSSVSKNSETAGRALIGY